MMVRNPIYPGFKWRQAFDFPENFFQGGDTVRAEFLNQSSPHLFYTASEHVRGVKVHDGAGWVGPIKMYDGTNWAQKALHGFDGSEWK